MIGLGITVKIVILMSYGESRDCVDDLADQRRDCDRNTKIVHDPSSVSVDEGHQSQNTCGFPQSAASINPL